MDITNKSRKLAYLLRHDKEYVFDEHGYRDVDDLIKNHSFTMSMLETIVRENNKKRFEFNDDKTKIRACQGHSVKVDVELKEATPPDILYHGTVESIWIQSGTLDFRKAHDCMSIFQKTLPRRLLLVVDTESRLCWLLIPSQWFKMVSNSIFPTMVFG